MSRTKAYLVSDANLARLGRSLDLGAHLRLGVGEEKSGGRDKASLVSAAFEALLGAVFLDGGTRAVRSLVRRLFLPELPDVAHAASRTDAKTALQELLQGRGLPAPRYQLVSEAGPDHRKRFLVRALLGGRILGEGTGPTKKAAEQRAAREALERWSAEPSEAPGSGKAV